MRPQDRLLYDPSLHLMGMVRLRDNGSWRLHPGRTVQEIIEADPLSHKPWTLGHAATLMADWWAAR